MIDSILSYVDPDTKRYVQKSWKGVPNRNDHLLTDDGNEFRVESVVWIDGGRGAQINLEPLVIGDQAQGYKGRVKVAVKEYLTGFNRSTPGDVLGEREAELLAAILPNWREMISEYREEADD